MYSLHREIDLLEVRMMLLRDGCIWEHNTPWSRPFLDARELVCSPVPLSGHKFTSLTSLYKLKRTYQPQWHHRLRQYQSKAAAVVLHSSPEAGRKQQLAAPRLRPHLQHQQPCQHLKQMSLKAEPKSQEKTICSQSSGRMAARLA